MNSESQSFHVKIGEVKTARAPDLLKATLGSCVAIALFWKKNGVFGLAHCLLPESPKPILEVGAKYVTQALPSLLALMKIKPQDFSEIEAVLVGGNNMMNFKSTSTAKSIGELNSAAARRALAELGIRIAHLDVGGNEGTQIVVDCATGSYQVNRISRQEE